MWNKTGADRHFIAPVQFDKPFKSIPTVLVSLSGLDTDCSKNARLYIDSKDIVASGFSAVISTYSDSKVFGAQISWIAFGV
jgi:hypothetical protein